MIHSNPFSESPLNYSHQSVQLTIFHFSTKTTQNQNQCTDRKQTKKAHRKKKNLNRPPKHSIVLFHYLPETKNNKYSKKEKLKKTKQTFQEIGLGSANNEPGARFPDSELLGLDARKGRK